MKKILEFFEYFSRDIRPKKHRFPKICAVIFTPNLCLYCLDYQNLEFSTSDIKFGINDQQNLCFRQKMRDSKALTTPCSTVGKIYPDFCKSIHVPSSTNLGRAFSSLATSPVIRVHEISIESKCMNIFREHYVILLLLI